MEEAAEERDLDMEGMEDMEGMDDEMYMDDQNQMEDPFGNGQQDQEEEDPRFPPGEPLEDSDKEEQPDPQDELDFYGQSAPDQKHVVIDNDGEEDGQAEDVTKHAKKPKKVEEEYDIDGLDAGEMDLPEQ